MPITITFAKHGPRTCNIAILGSNDKIHWKVLDVRVGVVFHQAQDEFTFDVSDAPPCRYFRKEEF